MIHFSPFNDPAGDNYHYFRGDDYDAKELDILSRYKRYNGTEGNSQESDQRYATAGKSTPDVEDINGDNTLNETEKYFGVQDLSPSKRFAGRCK